MVELGAVADSKIGVLIEISDEGVEMSVNARCNGKRQARMPRQASRK